MGFWDSVGKVGRVVGDVAKEAIEKHQAYKAEMASKSNSELVRILKERSHSMRTATALGELKSRGFSQEEINELVRNS